MQNDGDNVIRYVRVDEYGGRRYDRTIETAASNARQKQRTVGDKFWGRAWG